MKKGFSLIELMMVIAIIAILSVVMIPYLNGAKSRSRDTKRISDLSQIQLALGAFFNKCGIYPQPATGNVIDNSILTVTNSCGTTFDAFIARIPTAPNAGEVYNYNVNSTTGADDYFLEATLENANAVSNNSLVAPPAWFVTGGGAATYCNSPAYCVGPR